MSGKALVNGWTILTFQSQNRRPKKKKSRHFLPLFLGEEKEGKSEILENLELARSSLDKNDRDQARAEANQYVGSAKLLFETAFDQITDLRDQIIDYKK